MEMLAGLVLAITAATAPSVGETRDIPVVQAGKGVTFQELIGRDGKGSAHTEQSSVAHFHLDPGHASAWSHNRVGEESFFILSGTGSVWIGDRAQQVRAGSFVVVPPEMVRSVRADRGEPLEFFALTTPAWSASDDVHVAAPAGAPQ
jgi:mannose-6-phosphate isomerase-like protein (cupin superfamily)